MLLTSAPLCVVKSISNLPPAWPLLDWLPHGVCLLPVLALSVDMVFGSIVHPSACCANQRALCGWYLVCSTWPFPSIRFLAHQRSPAVLCSKLAWLVCQKCVPSSVGSTPFGLALWDLWCCLVVLHKRSTQQGGPHSPTLFSRVVAARFDALALEWCAICRCFFLWSSFSDLLSSLLFSSLLWSSLTLPPLLFHASTLSEVWLQNFLQQSQLVTYNYIQVHQIHNARYHKFEF